MENISLTCCYYQTTVVLIDDDQRFLESVGFKLGRTTAYKSFLYPLEALKFLKEEYQPRFFIQRCLLRPEEQQKDHRNIEIDVRAIHQEIYNPNRFGEISVLVIDYAMPGMNGLELCQQLKGSHFKIVLLTGEADEKIATELFNKGFINRYIRKDSPNFMQMLNTAITELQQEYFLDLSAIVINSLTKNPDYPPSCLDDPVFIKFFYKLCEQYKFAEYYLMDANGSYMFLDFEGNPSWLVVKDEDEMQAYVKIAEFADTEVSLSILEPLKNREKIIYLHDENEFKKEPAEWLTYLHPANKLEGKLTYYYSYIDNPKAYDIQADKVLSYKAFLDKS